jgi:hypothetical protein
MAGQKTPEEDPDSVPPADDPWSYPPPPSDDWAQAAVPPWSEPSPYGPAAAEPAPQNSADPWRIPPQPPWNPADDPLPPAPPAPSPPPPTYREVPPPPPTVPEFPARAPDQAERTMFDLPPSATAPRSTPRPPMGPAHNTQFPGTQGDVRFDEPWRREAPVRQRVGIRPRVVLFWVAGVVVAALVAGGVFVLTGKDQKEQGPSTPPAQLAGRLFAADPAATADGRDQELTSVAAFGSTVVATGDEYGSVNSRGEFLVSTDGGGSFRLADVRRSDGKEPPYGDVPRVVAGGSGGWVAFSGGAPAPTVVWTSRNGQSWTRQPDTAGAEFGRNDRVFKAVRTAAGFVAVGDTSAKGDFSDSTPVVWLSSDGRAWERIPADQLKMTLNGGAFSLMDVVAVGNTVLAYGWALNGEKKVVADGVWRSADGGRGWTAVSVPQPKGTGSTGMAIASTGSGFVLVRGAARPSGKKGEFYGVVLASPDAQRWTQTGEIDVPRYKALLRMAGSERGLAAVVVTDDKKTVLMRSSDGRTWQASGEVPQEGRTLQGVAVTAGATIVALRDASGPDVDAELAVRDTQGREIPIDLNRVPGASQPDQTVTSIASGGGHVVAAGSTNGDAAVWTSPDGRQWSRAHADARAFTRPGLQRLQEVTWGAGGWLAVGDDGQSQRRPLVVSSPDGTTWAAADDAGAFKGGHDAVPHTVAVASGPHGYVVVGDEGPSAVAWHSADLKSWERGSGDLAGKAASNRWMRSVAAGSFGYVAAGGLNDPATSSPGRPAVWSSADGVKWTLQRVPLPSGAVQATFDTIVAKGGVLVAGGTAKSANGEFAFAFTSPDSGRTWQEAKLPGVTQTALGTPATATPAGFVIAGVTGQWGSTNVVLWTSSDGRTWRLERPGGTGLAGPGDHWLTSLTTVGGDLLTTGVAADHRGEQPTLWRRPLP